MIQGIFLQSNEFVNALRNIFGGSFSEGLATLTPFIVFGVILATFGIGGFIVYRAIMTYRAFGEGLPLGRFRITNMGDRQVLTGYLSKSAVFDYQDDLDEMKQEPELRPLAESIIKNIQDERLFMYDFNIFDWGNAIRGKAKRVRLLSNEKLELDSASWIDQTGSRSWRSILYKDYIRNVVAYANSKYIEITNPDRNWDGYYILAVVPRINVGKSGIIMSNIIQPELEQIVINPSIPENSKEIAQAASFLQVIAEGLRRVRETKLHTSKLQDLLAKEQARNLSLKMKVNKLRRILIQQILIGYAKQQTPLQQMNIYAWLLGIGIATLFGTLVVPEMDGIRDSNIPSWLVGGATILAVVIIKYLMEQKQKPIDKSDVDETPENSEKIE